MDDGGFFTLFEKHIEHLKTKKKNILIIGGLNSDLSDKQIQMGKGSMIY